MRRRRGVVEVPLGSGRLGVVGGRWFGLVVVVWLALACVLGFAGVALAGTERCPNEEFRTGPATGLPDCRAYELVTPADLGRTQDMTFADQDHATPSSDGEHIALEATGTALEPNPGTSAFLVGTDAVFSRTSEGWRMKSAVAPGEGAVHKDMRLFSPDLSSQIALESYTALNETEVSPDAFEVGPVGGPYTLLANTPNNGQTDFLGANIGTVAVPPFSDVLLDSTDHTLPSPGAERRVAEEADEGANDLYDWVGGRLRLVNVTGEGSQVKLLNRCGAELGAGYPAEGPGERGAVSGDGSKIFFTSPQSATGQFTCPEPLPSGLYMRVDGRETVEVSASAPGVTVEPSERRPAKYVGATPDGSEVFFTTETALTADAPAEAGYELYVYDTRAPEGERLTFIDSGVHSGEGNRRYFVFSEDGTAIYYESGEAGGFNNIYRYEIGTGRKTFVARAHNPALANEPSYTTPNGEFLVFAALNVLGEGVVGEPRGAGHSELYRYDAADGSVRCLSCGEGVAPARGEMLEPYGAGALVTTTNETPGFIPMSENGQEVFFETTAQLVPQDRNSTEGGVKLSELTPGQDVYEWVADGAEEAPGVFCGVVNGCTHLLSSGEDVGPSVFLGASRDGHNVFFATAAQLVPQATPEFTNIYDARVDGGFAPPAPVSECLTCQGVGSPPPLFNVPASGPFAGASNPAVTVFKSGPNKKKKKKPKAKHGKRHGGRSKTVGHNSGRVGRASGRRRS